MIIYTPTVMASFEVIKPTDASQYERYMKTFHKTEICTIEIMKHQNTTAHET
jgi:hypothetical protein